MNEKIQAAIEQARVQCETICRERDERKNEILETIKAQHGAIVAESMEALAFEYEVVSEIVGGVLRNMPHEIAEKVATSLSTSTGKVRQLVLAQALSLRSIELGVADKMPKDSGIDIDGLRKLLDQLYANCNDTVKKLVAVSESVEAKINGMEH